jgi:hypothetical protein
VRSYVVSVHVPLLAEANGMIGAADWRSCGPGGLSDPGEPRRHRRRSGARWLFVIRSPWRGRGRRLCIGAAALRLRSSPYKGTLATDSC